MLDEPQIVQTDRQLTAVIRMTIPRSEIRSAMGAGMAELMQVISSQGLTPSGPLFSHHFRIDPEVFDFEIGVPVTSPVEEEGRVTCGELPGTTVLRATYRGPYEELASAWGEFESWIRDEGHSCSGELWECYVSGPESSSDPAEWRTELNRPLA